MSRTVSKVFIALALPLFAIPDVFSQKTTRVIVVDSISFEPLPALFARVKNTRTSLLADSTGIFTIRTKAADTLVLAHIGYYEVSIPLLFEEDAILV